ncbi:ATP-dependent helicase [Candidatus Woesearchaeota archaeon]|nr:ATP-dependent helicase [Candidatus Woesearchaeota archaeon]
MIKQKEKPDSKKGIDKILHPYVKKWFYSKFKEYSLPQKYGVMEIHSRNNVLISAPTGATKTLTAFLSILNELVDSADKGILEEKIYCVYVSPLKALNYDIEVNLVGPLKEIEKIAGKKLGIRVAVRTGDTSASDKAKMLKKPPHILITTPESLAIVLTTIKFRELLRKTEWCIVDEIHALAENKRGAYLSISLERLQKLAEHITRIGLSATISPIEEIAKFLVGYEGKKLRDCKIIDVQFIKKLDLKVLCPVNDLINTSHEEMHNAMYRLMDNLIQEHKTTLIFTNTRAATERVVNHLKEKFPKNYTENIGAHHGSLSKELRHSIEERLRKGKLKVVVSSTSLELGIDIGYIDLVILLGSPKSVARALQRCGRSGHKLHETAKGRIIVIDRDDLVECAVLLKSGVEGKIDRIHLPRNCLDVLAQQIYGIIISDKMHIDDLFKLIKNGYSFHDLNKSKFDEVISYLSGEYVSLESRYIYAKIWYDKETGMVGRKGRLARMIYMTNIGTIPDESFITVKVGDQIIGKIDEGFLERLRRGDVFVLGGEKYEFKFARGMTAQVNASVYRPPTIPSWVSEMLPLSFDLAVNIGKFRRLMEDRFEENQNKKDIIDFINSYLYVDKNSANSIYEYFNEQYSYAHIPSDKKLLVEFYSNEGEKHIVFHSLYGRRVNDVLSRAIAYIISKMTKAHVEIGVGDNGFLLTPKKNVIMIRVLKYLRSDKLKDILMTAIDKTEVLRRRFRHCATRSLMILRNYKGKRKRVGRQQVSSQILMSAVKRVSPNFAILDEARREVLEDLMDFDNAIKIVKGIEDGDIKVKEIFTNVPSPFAFNLIMQGYTDILKIEERIEFLRRMHQNVLAKIALKHKK